MAPWVIFHIGLEKTGTDSFQRFCKDHHQALLQQGVLYPVRSTACAEQSHGPLAACYLPHTDLSIAPPGRTRGDILASLQKEIEETSPNTVLISAEHFSSRFYDAQIAQLAADFADHPCEIVMVTRDHTSRIRSAYAQTILSGRSLSFDDYCSELLIPGHRYIRYRDTLI